MKRQFFYLRYLHHLQISLSFHIFFIASVMGTTMITIFFAVAVTITTTFQFATTTIYLETSVTVF